MGTEETRFLLRISLRLWQDSRKGVTDSYLRVVNLIDELKARGLVEALTDPAIEQALERPTTVYCGFDPSARSLQAGNLVSIVVLRRFQLAGHKVIALVGGATGLIGDPSGKSAERNMLTVVLSCKT